MTIAPNSKVQWLFRVTKSGQHFYEAKTQGVQAHKRKAGIIRLRSLVPQNTLPVPSSSVKQETPATEIVANLDDPFLKDKPRLVSRRIGGRPG